MNPMPVIPVFDMAGAPPSGEVLAAARRDLEAVLSLVARRKRWLGLSLAGAVLASGVAALAGIEWADPGGLASQDGSAMLEAVAGVVFGGFVGAGLGILPGAGYHTRHIWIPGENARRALADLDELEPVSLPTPCVEFIELCRLDPVVRAYQHRLVDMGRKPVMGEYLAAWAWVAKTRDAEPSDNGPERARQACTQLNRSI